MEDYNKRTREVCGYSVNTESKEIASANILEVEVGTNGFQGGDTGHGCRTYLRLSNLASTDISCDVDGDVYENIGEIVITLGGDTELSTFIDALKFAYERLKHQSKK